MDRSKMMGQRKSAPGTLGARQITLSTVQRWAAHNRITIDKS
jgi:hypothetical protein